jgi:hypothetical protein
MRHRLSIILYIILAAVILFLAFIGLRSFKMSSEEPEIVKIDTADVLIRQVKMCSRLYTAEVDVHKIITHDDQLKLTGSIMNKPVGIDIPFGKRKIAIPIDATLKAYIDFSNFSEVNVERYGDRIEVFLPDPKIVLTQSKVRNEDIKRYVPLLRSDFTDEELTHFEALGRRDIIDKVPKLGIMSMAQEGAANVIVPLLKQLGYKEENITVTFRKEFTIGDIRRMVEKG